MTDREEKEHRDKMIVHALMILTFSALFIYLKFKLQGSLMQSIIWSLIITILWVLPPYYVYKPTNKPKGKYETQQHKNAQ
jgi:hypothetical protein